MPDEQPTSPHIGLIVGAETRTLFAVFNVRDEAEIDDSVHLANLKGDYGIAEPLEMLRAERGAVEFAGSLEELDFLVDVICGGERARPPRVKAADHAEPLLGMVVGTSTRTVYTVTVPGGNHELDNARLLLFQPEPAEPVTMVLLPRGEAPITPENLQTRIADWYVEHYMQRPPYSGPDSILA